MSSLAWSAVNADRADYDSEEDDSAAEQRVFDESETVLKVNRLKPDSSWHAVQQWRRSTYGPSSNMKRPTTSQVSFVSSHDRAHETGSVQTTVFRGEPLPDSVSRPARSYNSLTGVHASSDEAARRSQSGKFTIHHRPVEHRSRRPSSSSTKARVRGLSVYDALTVCLLWFYRDATPHRVTLISVRTSKLLCFGQQRYYWGAAGCRWE